MYKSIVSAVGMAAVVCLAFGQTRQKPVNTFTDTRNGKTYRTVQIGKQVWMAENLNYDAKGSKCYENSPDSCAKYGRLYPWDGAVNACPSGFRLPASKEWMMLVKSAGGEKNAGKKLKSTSGWEWNDYQNISGDGTDDYNFAALPGGWGSSGGSFYAAGAGGFWWGATEYDDSDAWIREMRYSDKNVSWNHSLKTRLFSVRCLQD